MKISTLSWSWHDTKSSGGDDSYFGVKKNHLTAYPDTWLALPSQICALNNSLACFFLKAWVYNQALNRFKPHDLTGMCAIWMHGSVTPRCCQLSQSHYVRAADDLCSADLRAAATSCSLLPRFLPRPDVRPQWTYGLSAECISCGLSLAWPLPSYWKLEVAVCMQDFVLTGTACYYRWAPGSQETMVYSETHLFQKKKTEGTGYKEKKGGICLPAACIGCNRSECFALAKKAGEIFGAELKWCEKAELFPHVQSSSYVLSILAWGLFQPVTH